MRVSEAMTRDVRIAHPGQTIREAAAMMADIDAGVLPVADDNRLLGMITDRDITIRATAAGLGPDETQVNEVMTEDVCHCYEDQTIDEVMQDMRDLQVRRVPVVSRDTHTLIGIVALADLTDPEADTDAEETAETLRDISAPIGGGQQSAQA